ncbi:MAG: hypothetical protein KGJ23_12495 [Euryarchaeota archaeon]|nr:hypothetical protein [Euryarchaeota archaeon]MDE1837417.1 hypothetical protein [Euryarchaeota archaeon]MDE1879900.1 hypothetical protein [Euryarchaeota archaeon]MDE2045483.1 hypothetical protein [Thermoplasmata archaeon]
MPVLVRISGEARKAIEDLVRRTYGTVTQTLVEGQLEAAVWEFVNRNGRGDPRGVDLARAGGSPIKKSGWAYMKQRYPSAASVRAEIAKRTHSPGYQRVLQALEHYWQVREAPRK